jgi:hypothetical protein
MKRSTLFLGLLSLVIMMGAGCVGENKKEVNNDTLIPSATCQIGTTATVQYASDWVEVEIMGGPNENGECQVKYSNSEEAWVDADDIITKELCLPGKAINVWSEDKTKLYPAKVISGTEDACLVHYDGYDSSWDETVDKDRLDVQVRNTPDNQ